MESIPCLTLRVSTPTSPTSHPRRSNYGICNLSLRCYPTNGGVVEILSVKDSNKCYLLICKFLFILFFRSIVLVQRLIIYYSDSFIFHKGRHGCQYEEGVSTWFSPLSHKSILSYFLIIWLIISYIARIVPSIRPVLGHVPVHKQELSGKMV